MENKVDFTLLLNMFFDICNELKYHVMPDFLLKELLMLHDRSLIPLNYHR